MSPAEFLEYCDKLVKFLTSLKNAIGGTANKRIRKVELMRSQIDPSNRLDLYTAACEAATSIAMANLVLATHPEKELQNHKFFHILDKVCEILDPEPKNRAILIMEQHAQLKNLPPSMVLLKHYGSLFLEALAIISLQAQREGVPISH